jgi:hypothetical protein
MTVLNGKPTFGAGRAFLTGNYANPTPPAPSCRSPSRSTSSARPKACSANGSSRAVGAGEMEVTGKVEYGKINPRIVSDILFGDGQTTGSYLEADKEAATVPGASTYVVTVANATGYQFDLGVVNATTGVIYTCVAAGAEVAGLSYSVVTSGANKGKYTFAAGDANANVQISYGYANTGVGSTVVLGNQMQGQTGSFQAIHVLPWGMQQDMFVFYNCIAGSAGISLKKSGFASNTIDYTAGVNANDQLGLAAFAEAA